MNEDEPQRWLTEYVRTGNEAAFRAMVGHYLNLVYSVALRKVGGDTHLAHDVTQQVFIDLAHKAASLRGATLGGWLHQHTCFRSATLVRAEVRRRIREQKAVAMIALDQEARSTWERIVPLLDEALDALPRRYRDAIVLRFFEQRTLAEVARNLCTTEATAQKRVERGLQKLRVYFSRRGVATSAKTLGATLVTHAVQAAPAKLHAETATRALSASSAKGACDWTQMFGYHLCRHAGIVTTVGAAAVFALIALLATGRPPLRGEPALVALMQPTSGKLETAVASGGAGITGAEKGQTASFQEAPFPSLPALGERPTASLVLAHMLKAYGECRSYLDRGTITQARVQGGRTRTSELSFSTVFLRPGRLRYESYDTRPDRPNAFIFWADGSEAHTWWDIANPHDQIATWDSGFTGVAVHTHVASAFVARALEPTRFDALPLQDVLAPTGIAEAETVEGTECFRLHCRFSQDELLLWVDKVSHLLRKAYWQHDFGNFLIQKSVVYRPALDADIPAELLKFDPPPR